MDGGTSQETLPAPIASNTTSLDQQKVSADTSVTARFERWKASAMKSAVFLCRTIDGHIEYTGVPLHISNRWCPEGAKNQRRKLWKVLDHSDSFGVLLTLTEDTKHYETIEEALLSLWRRWGQFRDTLNQRLKRSGKKKLVYIIVLEFTKRGWPHLHIWCPGRTYIAPQAELQALWGAIIDVRHVRGNAASYVCKYVGKMHTLPVELQAIMWDNRIRSYAVSPILRVIIWRKTPQGWELLGFVWAPHIAQATGRLKLADFIRDGPRHVSSKTETSRWYIECALADEEYRLRDPIGWQASEEKAAQNRAAILAAKAAANAKASAPPRQDLLF